MKLHIEIHCAGAFQTTRDTTLELTEGTTITFGDNQLFVKLPEEERPVHIILRPTEYALLSINQKQDTEL